MKVSVEDKQGLFKLLRVEVEGEIVKKSVDEVYNYLKERAEVEGFRRGKAPLWIIKAKFKDYIQEEVGKKVANATLGDAIKESGLKPVADIYLEEVQFQEENQKVSYSVAFEVPPSFELAGLDNLTVEVKRLEFNEDLLKKKVEEIREEHAIWEPVEREIREGDLVIVDYKIEDLEEGEVVEGETSGVVGLKTLREEIEKELIGKREGDSFILEEITLYDVEGKPAGKAKVEIKIKGIKEKRLPEVGDDFAKELGLGQTWAEVEEKLREEVKKELEATNKTLIENALAQKLVDMHNFDVPQTLLQRELSYLVQSRASTLSQWGIDPKYLDYRSMAQELMPQAIFNIKLRYILDKYAQTKDIQVSGEEINKRLEELAQQYGKTTEELRDYFKRENLMDILEEDLRREKALQEIASRVTVKEPEEKKEENNENT